MTLEQASLYEPMMTSTPSGSKEKQKTPEGLGIPTDWRVHTINQPTEESLAVLQRHHSI